MKKLDYFSQGGVGGLGENNAEERHRLLFFLDIDLDIDIDFFFFSHSYSVYRFSLRTLKYIMITFLRYGSLIYH